MSTIRDFNNIAIPKLLHDYVNYYNKTPRANQLSFIVSAGAGVLRSIVETITQGADVDTQKELAREIFKHAFSEKIDSESRTDIETGKTITTKLDGKSVN